MPLSIRAALIAKIVLIVSLVSLAADLASACPGHPTVPATPLDIRDYLHPGETTYEKAFERAIDSASACGGGSLYVPSGRFTVRAPVQLKNDIRIAGDGESSVIVFPAADSGRFRVNMTKRVEFQALAFEHQGMGGSYAIVSEAATFGARKLRVRDCRFYHCGLLLAGNSDKDGHWGRFADIVGNEFEGRMARILLSGWRQATVTGNTISAQDIPGANNNVSGIRCENRSSDIAIANNTTYRCTQNGIQVYSGSDIVVSGNLSFENLQSGIGVNTDDVSDWPRQVSITGNVCRNNAFDGIDVNTVPGSELRLTVANNLCSRNEKTGIYLAGARGASVTGNICDRNGNTGIFLNRSSYVTLSANYLHSNNSIAHPKDAPGDKNGMTLQDGEDCTVTGNIAGNEAADSSQQYGIELLGRSQRNSLIGNVLHRNRVGGLRVSRNPDLRGKNTLQGNLYPSSGP